MLEIFDHFQRLAWCNNLIKIPGMVEKKNRLRHLKSWQGILAGKPPKELPGFNNHIN